MGLADLALALLGLLLFGQARFRELLFEAGGIFADIFLLRHPAIAIGIGRLEAGDAHRVEFGAVDLAVMVAVIVMDEGAAFMRSGEGGRAGGGNDGGDQDGTGVHGVSPEYQAASKASV